MIMQLRLAGMGLSLVTRSPRVGPHELIFMKLQTITIEYDLNQSVPSFSLSYFQLQH